MVILFLTFGLGNRLRVLSSAYELCKQNQHKLLVIWPKENDLNAGFYDFFKAKHLNINTIRCGRFLHQFIEYFFKYSRRCSFLKLSIINGNFVLKNKAEGMMKLLKNNKFILLRTCYELKNSYSLDDIQFTERIINKSILTLKTDLNFDNLIGVHIRRTDSKWSIENSPLHVFIEKMDLLLQQNHALYFYVASDDESEKCRLKEIFKDRVITQPMTDYNRDSFQGIENSVVELYNLSCCKKILGSYGSSFSEIASRFGHCEFIMVSDNIDRDSRKLLEVDINKLDEPKLTRKEWFYYYLHFFQFYK